MSILKQMKLSQVLLLMTGITTGCASDVNKENTSATKTDTIIPFSLFEKTYSETDGTTLIVTADFSYSDLPNSFSNELVGDTMELVIEKTKDQQICFTAYGVRGFDDNTGFHLEKMILPDKKEIYYYVAPHAKVPKNSFYSSTGKAPLKYQILFPEDSLKKDYKYFMVKRPWK
ncbi:MAG: hypothetical protein IAF38_00915 [Bacteroidia bacterium]|nr:hypothetical protein [Bacteroidia bacterium]